MSTSSTAPRLLSLLCLLALAPACGDSSGDDTAANTTADTTAGTTTGLSTGDSDPGTGNVSAPTTSNDATSVTGDAPTTTGTSTATTAETTIATTSETGTTATTDEPDPSGDPVLALPPADAGLDYQLGGAYPPPADVGVVSRDRNDPPAAGLYNVCYVNGFQAQPDEASFWLDEHPDLILRDANDEPIIDADWDEMLLDTSTPEKRAALAQIVGGWIAGCGAAGYDAVEIDNLDSYARSTGLLDQDQAVEFMALLSAAAHAGGMAIAQKNSTELLDRRAEMGTDFAVSEECNHYDECDDYIATYGDAVLMIEYSDADFAAGCAAYPQISIVRRDLDLTMPGDKAYVYDAC